MLSADRLRKLLHYDPETGVFVRVVAGRGRSSRVGDVAGTRRADGYLRLCVGGNVYRSHRLAWLYMTGAWPENEVDHINNDPSDNRWSNLRAATRSQNEANKRARLGKEIGLKGVYFHKQTQKWRARIEICGKRESLGYFDCPAAAHLAYVIAAEMHFGEFARAA